MKKFDLHIHTIPTISDAGFTFCLNKLQEYVASMKLDCIAITNHNVFDLDQYRNIKASLDIRVLPGIEINLEKCHMLLISDIDELLEFSKKCSSVKSFIHSPTDSISVAQLQSIFGDLSKYLLIPHYDKKPEIDDVTLNQLRNYIVAGEVNSVKKFSSCLKDTNSLVPVLFSDCRLTESVVSFCTKQTYIDISEITISNLRLALADKNKVALSKQDGHRLFQALDNGLLLSTGLNVILGERSTGKTYTLRKLSQSHANVKYIKQFSLLETDEEGDKKRFDSLLSKRQSSITQDYLKEFKDVVDDITLIDYQQNVHSVTRYVETLLKNAAEIEKADNFSKTTMFSESEFPDQNLDGLKTLIDSVRLLAENIEYRSIIDKYISTEGLRLLSIELMEQYQKEREASLKKDWVNDIVYNIKSALQLRTAATPIEDVDLHKFIIDREKVRKFGIVVHFLKKEIEVSRKEIHPFTVVANAKLFTGAGELKGISRSKFGFSDAYREYGNAYNFLLELKKIDGLDPSDYYKFFIKIEYKILNKHGYEVSGGERSEFNLLHEISDALQYDMLLIDEPESSFDNLFLKNDVNDLMKSISTHIPVVVVTHNNTVGFSIKPDYIVYTKKKIADGDISYQIFYGHPTDKLLLSLDGETIKNYDIILDCLEAGKPAYEERGGSYEMLKN